MARLVSWFRSRRALLVTQDELMDRIIHLERQLHDARSQP